MHAFHLSSPGKRPPFYELAQHLWGVGCDVDSDGNSSNPDATDWTELTIRLRYSAKIKRRLSSLAACQPLLELNVRIRLNGADASFDKRSPYAFRIRERTAVVEIEVVGNVERVDP